MVKEVEVETREEVKVVVFDDATLSSDPVNDAGDDGFFPTFDSATIFPFMICLLVNSGFTDGRDPKIGSRTSKYLQAA